MTQPLATHEALTRVALPVPNRRCPSVLVDALGYPIHTKGLDATNASWTSIGTMERILYQTLAGRVRWEQTTAGIHVEIPTQKDWSAILAVSTIEIWCLRGLAIVPERFSSTGQTGGVPWIALTGFACVAALSLIWLLWTLVGKSRISLDQVELKIERQILEVHLDTRTFRTREVRNLRYLPCSEFRIFKGFVPGVFCFEAEDKTHRFGSGTTDIEAFALLNEMLDVYEFPIDRAVHYIGRRS